MRTVSVAILAVSALSLAATFDAIVARHRAAIVAPDIDWESGTVRTRAATLRKAEEEARHAASRAAALEFLRTP